MMRILQSLQIFYIHYSVVYMLFHCLIFIAIVKISYLNINIDHRAIKSISGLKNSFSHFSMHMKHLEILRCNF